jgi:uncharacterized SAM-binding protein YcdF (DUF218 family)
MSEPSLEHIESEDPVEKIIGGKPEAVFVLSASTVKLPGTQAGETKYKSTSYHDVDQHGLLGGGKYRVLAGAEIYKHFPDVKIVTTSRSMAGGEDEPTDAAVMASELEQLEVPKESIILEETSVSTMTMLYEMAKLANQNGWKSVAIVSNRYHLERLKEMFKKMLETSATDPALLQSINYLKDNTKVFFVSAEDILPVRKADYDRLEKVIQGTKAYQDRVAAEQNGIEALKAGSYHSIAEEKDAAAEDQSPDQGERS